MTQKIINTYTDVNEGDFFVCRELEYFVDKACTKPGIVMEKDMAKQLILVRYIKEEKEKDPVDLFVKMPAGYNVSKKDMLEYLEKRLYRLGHWRSALERTDMLEHESLYNALKARKHNILDNLTTRLRTANTKEQIVEVARSYVEPIGTHVFIMCGEYTRESSDRPTVFLRAVKIPDFYKLTEDLVAQMLMSYNDLHNVIPSSKEGLFSRAYCDLNSLEVYQVPSIALSLVKNPVIINTSFKIEKTKINL